MGERSLTTIIVNWKTPALSIEAARSALETTPAGTANHVLVVDNASDDDSLDALAACDLPIEVVANDVNRGFAAANNQGCSLAETDYVLLLNSDARLEPGALGALLDRIDGTPSAGAVGSRLVYGDGRFQRWTAGREPALAAAAVYLLGLDRLAPLATSGIYLGRDVAEAFRPDWVSAACMLCRRAALFEVGLMDERYFYMEDVDLCRRLRSAGYEVWYEPAAVATHLMGASTRQIGSGAGPVALQSFNRYFAERHSAAASVALRCAEVAGFGARSVAHALAGVAGRDRARHRSAARAHIARVRPSEGADRPPGSAGPSARELAHG